MNNKKRERECKLSSQMEELVPCLFDFNWIGFQRPANIPLDCELILCGLCGGGVWLFRKSGNNQFWLVNSTRPMRWTSEFILFGHLYCFRLGVQEERRKTPNPFEFNLPPNDRGCLEDVLLLGEQDKTSRKLSWSRRLLYRISLGTNRVLLYAAVHILKK